MQRQLAFRCSELISDQFRYMSRGSLGISVVCNMLSTGAVVWPNRVESREGSCVCYIYIYIKRRDKITTQNKHTVLYTSWALLYCSENISITPLSAPQCRFFCSMTISMYPHWPCAVAQLPYQLAAYCQ
ncbi:hypothetical protein XENTR_v10007300 [Xenopus tropicalis]|nr:hypothetical protein XENTR_v10007300 [Xenopus tropicalis]